jgi:Na+:H+ antiporter, NhaA family
MGRLAKRVLRPVERFLRIEAASGIVLLATALAALVWANSPWSQSYEQLWHTPLRLAWASWSFDLDLHFVINDGLMTIFFFVVGLEIRRELAGGELSELRRAALPLTAALGGMVLPALIFFAFSHGSAVSSGWGIPMATDIAFAVGVLALLGKRVPPALRILLLALAVIDDVGAILVIALFYSSGFHGAGFGVLALGVGGILAMQRLGVRSPYAYLLPGIAVWAGMLLAGVHPTLAGVIVGLLTPSKAQGEAGAPSPVERLEEALHGWVAFAIMPLFALANSGVPVGDAALDVDASRLALGITAGLVLGKSIGIFGAPWLASRLGLVTLPRGVRWSGVLVVGLVGGIGFTMSLFIADLAFPPGLHLETAKLAVLGGSGLAAVIGLIVGRAVLGAIAPASGVARSEHEAETSTAA